MFIPSQSTFTAAEKITLAKPTGATTAQSGLVAGTLLETRNGWRPVERLMRGDAVYTYDGGLRRIETLDRRFVDAKTVAEGLVEIPGGVLSNAEDLLVLPDQRLLIETNAFGGLATLVRAADLVGHAGIHWVPSRRPLQLLRPIFAEEEVVWANGGLLVRCQGLAGSSGYFDSAKPADLTRLHRALSVGDATGRAA